MFKLTPANRLYWKLQLQDAKGLLPVFILLIISLLLFSGLSLFFNDINEQNKSQVQACELTFKCKKMPNYYLDSFPTN